MLKDGYTPVAEQFLRKLFEGGDKPGEAVATWRNQIRATEAARFPRLALAQFGGGAYSAQDLRDAVSAASVKSGDVVRRVFEHQAGFYAVIEAEAAAGGREWFTLYKLIPPAHWKLKHKDGEAFTAGWTGLAVRDTEDPPRAWVIGMEAVEVECAGEVGHE